MSGGGDGGGGVFGNVFEEGEWRGGSDETDDENEGRGEGYTRAREKWRRVNLLLHFGRLSGRRIWDWRVYHENSVHTIELFLCPPPRRLTVSRDKHRI